MVRRPTARKFRVALCRVSGGAAFGPKGARLQSACASCRYMLPVRAASAYCRERGPVRVPAKAPDQWQLAGIAEPSGQFNRPGLAEHMLYKARIFFRTQTERPVGQNRSAVNALWPKTFQGNSPSQVIRQDGQTGGTDGRTLQRFYEFFQVPLRYHVFQAP